MSAKTDHNRDVEYYQDYTLNNISNTIKDFLAGIGVKDSLYDGCTPIMPIRSIKIKDLEKLDTNIKNYIV